MFNWRPVYDIEQRELESRKRTNQLKIESLESEKQIVESDKRLKHLRTETEQLKKENKRLAALEFRMDALLLNADSSSQTPPSTGSN